MSSIARNRSRCPKCNQKLSYSAFLRHKNPLVCPCPSAAGVELIPIVDHGLQQYETSIEADANERFEMQSQLSANSDTDDQPDTLMKGSNFDTPEQEVCVEDFDVIESEIQVFNDVDDSEMPTDTDTESNCNQVANSGNGHETVQIVTTNAATEASVQECKSKSSLYDVIIQPFTVGLYIFHLIFRVSDRGINFIL